MAEITDLPSLLTLLLETLKAYERRFCKMDSELGGLLAAVPLDGEAGLRYQIGRDNSLRASAAASAVLIRSLDEALQRLPDNQA